MRAASGNVKLSPVKTRAVSEESARFMHLILDTGKPLRVRLLEFLVASCFGVSAASRATPVSPVSRAGRIPTKDTFQASTSRLRVRHVLTRTGILVLQLVANRGT